jgi:hypothetical protein
MLVTEPSASFGVVTPASAIQPASKVGFANLEMSAVPTEGLYHEPNRDYSAVVAIVDSAQHGFDCAGTLVGEEQFRR